MSQNTSFESSDKWYDTLVGKEGHYYHQKIVIPNTLRLLELDKTPSASLLDLACGQGVLSRAIKKSVIYHGVDLSPSLVQSAKKQNVSPHATFSQGDICKSLPLAGKQFTHATIILALQNIEEPSLAIREAAQHILRGGTLLIVLNHPCFRIPRQSHWGIDEKRKLQYRRMDLYMSPLKIPIQTHPGKEGGEQTWTFHHPLSSFSAWLYAVGFSITLIEEWTSDKQSTGKNAKMENRARQEFPLFLAIKATKS